MASLIPKVGFVSLGCPKAGSDSERILTQLRAEGYDISKSYQDADLVVVNTCGFIWHPFILCARKITTMASLPWRSLRSA